MKKLITIALLVVFSVSLSAQELPFRIGLKLGVPNLAGLGVEYMINDKIGVDFDGSYFSLSVDDQTELSYTYLAGGASYYFNKNGEGLFGGLSFGRMSFGITQSDIMSDYDYTLTGGEADFSIGVMVFGAKVGYRWIWGAFSLTPEIGYAMASIDDEVEMEVTFPDGTTETQKYETGDIPIGGGATGALTIGFAF